MAVRRDAGGGEQSDGGCFGGQKFGAGEALLAVLVLKPWLKS